MSMNRVALVTGAGRGIGRAIALKLAGAGWDVAVNYRTSAAGAEEIASNIIILGRRAIAVQADVANAQAVRAMVADVEDRLGPVSLLVNNAGLSWMVSGASVPRSVRRRSNSFQEGGAMKIRTASGRFCTTFPAP